MTERSEGMNLEADRPEGVRSHAGLCGKRHQRRKD